MKQIARDRLGDARALLRARRYSGPLYLCGYSVEVALKARICHHLGWKGFPEKPADMGDDVLRVFKVHDLAYLLKFSGRQDKILDRPYDSQWVFVKKNWGPAQRYQPATTDTKETAEEMLESCRSLVSVILPR